MSLLPQNAFHWVPVTWFRSLWTKLCQLSRNIVSTLVSLSKVPPFGINLVLVWVFGIFSLAWILFYTDWFPEVGGILALGGVFSWFAFVAKILSEQRTKGLQEWVDHWIFCARHTTAVFVVLIVGVMVWTGRRGTIRIESMQETTNRVVRLYSNGTLLSEPVQLATRGEVHIPLSTSADSPLRLRVKVNGYPDMPVLLRPREIFRLYLPESFLRPVILLRPTVELMESVVNSPVKLEVKAGNDTATIASFTGQAVWVGCDDDVEIPEALQDAWRVELAARQKPELIQKWLNPEAAVFQGKPYLELAVKQQVGVREEGVQKPLSVIIVRPLHSRSSFPQVEDLDVPK